ncbi:MAG: DUF4129 domain-containing protein [Mycobacterium sp.]|nr:DUF4129 domain-containing protein [Mycobacterium sp.]
MFDKATGRVVAVIVLLIVIAVSLRGYLPGIEPAPRQRPPSSPASLVYVVVLLSVSLVIVAVAVIIRLRDPRKAPVNVGSLPDRLGGAVGRPGWRVLLIGSGLLVGWLLVVWLLSQFIVQHGTGRLAPGPESPASAPAPGNNTVPPPQPRDLSGDGDVLNYLIASTVALLVLSIVGTIVATRRRRITQPRMVAAELVRPPALTATSESLVRAAEVGLAEIGDLSREPREAIIACYAAMERELAHVPGAVPQDFDTPTEVLARAVEHHALQADNASQLVKLFAEARFSPHVMDEGHRASALGVLQLVLAELRSVV